MNTSHSASILSILSLALASAGLAATLGPVIRLTSDPGQDIYPAWDPASDTIAYMRSTAVSGSGVPYDLWMVEADTPGESLMATGPIYGYGLANSPWWIGSTGLLGLEERCVFHEYLSFAASNAPFTRTATDGGDAAFTKLAGVPGGGGGGWIRFSRDGSTALWRASTSGGAGTQYIQAGPVAALNGGSASSLGTTLLTTSHSTEQRLQIPGTLSPDGSMAIVAMPPTGVNGSNTLPTDLWALPTDGTGSPVNLTNNAAEGWYNRHPDISPDGTKIIFTRYSGVTGDTWELVLMNIDGSGVEALTASPHFSEYAPSWSPDGNRVAFHGSHVAGYEQTDPALPGGEVANANIYVATVTLGTVMEAPQLAIHGAAELEWPTVAGGRYQIQTSTDMEIWTNVGDPIDGDGNPRYELVSTRAAPGAFFQILIVTEPK